MVIIITMMVDDITINYCYCKKDAFSIVTFVFPSMINIFVHRFHLV